MKILYIAPLPPPVTGHSLAAKILLDELVKDHRVEVINLSKQGFKQGVDSIKRIFQVFAIIRAVFRGKNDCDVIYLTISESIAGNFKDLFIYLVCFNKLHRMVIHLHGGSIKKNIFDKYRSLRVINTFFIRRLAAVIVLGESHLGIFSNLIDSKKIHVISNFAEDYLFVSQDEIKEKFEQTLPLRILFMSNLIEGKGYNELLDAFLGLRDDLKRIVRVDFAGDFESESQKDEFLIRIVPHKEIQYHGTVSGSEKKFLFANAHVFCLPTSLNEGQPISILEAYASGCVVITTDQGGIRDIFTDGINGYEVLKNSADSIRSVLEVLFGSAHPSSLCRMALNNRAKADELYRTDRYNARLLSIVEGLQHSTTYNFNTPT